MKALAIVAHPDDETIWMFSQLKKDYDWTIFSLCRANDPDRSPKFLAACDYYKAKPIITNLEDDKLDPIDLNEIINLIEEYLKENEFDIIYTHGINGEYGHIRHKEVHQAVKKMVKDGKLKGKLSFFNYKKRNDYCIAIKNKKGYYKLNQEGIKEKKKIITEMYGFDVGSFEEKCCGDESFI